MVLFVCFSSLLFLLSLAQVAESQVTITNQPSSPLSVSEGQPLTLEWTFSFIGTTFVRLEFEIVGASRAIVEVIGGLKIIRDDRFKVNNTETNTTILLLAVNRNDSNSYQFEVVASDGTSATANLEIIVEYPPSLTTRAQDQVVLEGGSQIELNCVADGGPKPNITWTKVNNGSDSDILFTGDNFVLPNNRSSTGTYRCNASNGIGSDVNHTVTVVVHFKPENFMFKVESTNQNICKGDTFNITCSAEGSPAVHTYQLFENDDLVQTNNNYSTLFRNKEATVGGTFLYTCDANNTVSTANTTRNVTVNVGSVIWPLENITVMEGTNTTLNCSTTPGIPMPSVVWLEVKTGNRSFENPLVLSSVSRDKAGEYKCEASNVCKNDTKSLILTVNFKADIVDFVANATTVCQNDVVSFNCSAVGNPAVHTYLLYINGIMTDSNSLGVWTQTMTTGGMVNFTCVANNTLGTDSRTVAVTVNVAASIQPNISGKVVREGSNVTLFCNASGIPEPLVSWVNVRNDQRTPGKTLALESITRHQAGEWRCKASNPCGNDTESATIDVQFEPEMVQLVPNETTACLGDYIMFNCSAKSNPDVHTYQLYVNGMMVNETSTTGVWNRIMTTRGEFVYKCMVNNSVGTAMSTNVTITVNVPSFIQPIDDEMIIEGGNVTLTCNASGFPTPNVSWFKTGNGQLTNGTELVLTNVSRDQAGEYRCEASNLCNTATELATVDVQFKPEMVVLDPSATTVCRGDIIVFNCSAYSNPEVHTYELYVNGTMVNEIGRMGIWNITMATRGVFVYKCMANNTIGTAMSMNVSVTVNEPSSIDPFTNKKIIEGENLTILCVATGTLPLTVSWVNTSDGERTNGTELVFTYIDRTEAGEYRCEASNLCGSASESVKIDVLFKPEMVQLFASKATVCNGSSVILNCSAYGNPMVHTYHLYENGSMVEEISSTGVWTRTMSTGGEFVFKCMVNNTVGTAMSPNVSVIVNEPSSIDPFTKKNVIEEEDLTIRCEATGTPPPNVSWVKTSDGVRISGKHLVFTDIIRTEAGEYRCEASNLCGNASESVEIDVFFKPEMVQLFASEATVYFGASITFNCSAKSHPMVHTYHLYENGNMVEEISSTGVWTRTMSTGGEFVFKCMVNNTVGTAMSPNVSVIVNGEKCEENCADGEECLAFGTKYFCRCPEGKTGENCQQNDAPVDRVEVGFQFTKAEFIPEYEDLENQKTILFIQTVKQAIKTEMNGTGLRDVIVQRLRRGSVIADVELLFNSSVAKDAIKGLIEEALEDKKLGNLDVGQFKFDGVIPVPTEQPIQCSQFFEGPDCKQATGALIALIVVAVVVVVALLIAIVACSLQKKNATGQGSVQNGKYSQRQDPEGHGTVGKEGNVYGGVTSGRNGHGSVNTGFEDETAQGGTPMVTFNSNNAQTPGITLNDSRSQET